MILASSCPSCFAQASEKACGSLRTASSSTLVWAFKVPTSRKSNRILACRLRILQFFPCAGKNLRVHSQLPACSEAAGEKSSSGQERSRQFSLGASDLRQPGGKPFCHQVE